ncbi:MAG TPA: LysR substrate-binding domain-containing protein, partial [Cellvibrionaceae bacterium]
AHVHTSHEAVRRGLGYAWLPLGYVADDLASGALVRLPVVEGSERVVPMHLVYSDRDLAGPATRRLGEIFMEMLPGLTTQ